MPPLRESRILLPTAETDIAYLAGILDGEGSIFRRVPLPKIKWGVEVANTDWGLMTWLAEIGGSVRAEERLLPSKTCYHWLVLARRDVLALLGAVRPYLRIKAPQADTALDELLNLERAV